MEINSDILNELKDISPVLGAIEKTNVFTVPEGYFEKLSADVLVALKVEGGLLHTTVEPYLSEVPDGYFESLAASILNKIKTLDNAGEELESLSPVLHNLPQQNVFTVPDGYFDALPAAVLDSINTVNDVPAELNEWSPMLAAAQKINVFTVPEGYFESLSGQIINSVQPAQAKLVSMPSRTTVFLRYAVAAVFTGVMALGVYQFAENGSTSITELPGFYADAKKIKDVDAELTKVSDDDIIKYLQANGENIDAQTLASNIAADNELPAQEDYLIDDKALDKFLDNIDINDLKN
jgi:hypothetical protein